MDPDGDVGCFRIDRLRRVLRTMRNEARLVGAFGAEQDRARRRMN